MKKEFIKACSTEVAAAFMKIMGRIVNFICEMAVLSIKVFIVTSIVLSITGVVVANTLNFLQEKGVIVTTYKQTQKEIHAMEKAAFIESGKVNK
ncbi:MAG: hypothetical protein FWH05_09275 [Oscillospiraceae bacterium]|nr:hypothetical protein [Oscillospiraceae bacterium]